MQARLDAVIAEQDDRAASLALSWPGSPVRIPLQAHLTAIDAEMARRGTPPP